MLLIVECVADDCPFDKDWRGGAAKVPILVAGHLPPPSAPPKVLVPEVNLGVLLPMFGTEAAGYSTISWSPRGGVYQALRELNDKNDGVADDLLPNTQLHFAWRDDKCDSRFALQAALQLTQYAFQGSGVSAIIGAGCSSACQITAQVAEGSSVPIVSSSCLSPALSNGRAYPYFLRTVCEHSAVFEPAYAPSKLPGVGMRVTLGCSNVPILLAHVRFC